MTSAAGQARGGGENQEDTLILAPTAQTPFHSRLPIPMSLKFDPVDVVGAGCWDVLMRLFLYGSSLWMGSGIGAWALYGADLFDSPLQPIITFLIGPAFPLSSLVFLTFPAVLIGMFVFIRTEKDIAPRWAAFATLIGLLIPLGNFRNIERHWLTWPVWLLLDSMMCVGTWFFIQGQRNRWIQQLETLKQQNHQRRVEMHEEFGTSPVKLCDKNVEWEGNKNQSSMVSPATSRYFASSVRRTGTG